MKKEIVIVGLGPKTCGTIADFTQRAVKEKIDEYSFTLCAVKDAKRLKKKRQRVVIFLLTENTAHKAMLTIEQLQAKGYMTIVLSHIAEEDPLCQEIAKISTIMEFPPDDKVLYEAIHLAFWKLEMRDREDALKEMKGVYAGG